MKGLSREGSGARGQESGVGFREHGSLTPGPWPLLTDRVVWLTILAAFVIRLIYNVALHPEGRGPGDFVIDEAEYFGAAQILAGGRGFSFFDTALWVRPPLYVVFLGSLFKLFGLGTLPVLVAQSALGALTLLPLGWLAGRVGGRSAARWTVGLGAVYLPFALFSGLLLSETLFVFLFAVALVSLVCVREALREGPNARAIRWAAMGGLALGLAVLTRSTALGFVPLAAVWLGYAGRREPATRSRILAAGAVLGVCVLAVLPWTLRNYAAYGQLVPVDTTSGYNLWLGSVGVRDEERLRADLAPIANPVERQAFAYQRAWENIRADPAAFIAKGVKESLDLWRPLFSAEERQVSGYSLGRVPAWHLLSLLVFDDLLYMAVLLLAGVGLVLGPSQPLKSLTLLWVGLWVLMSFVFFAVTRFRLPVVAALLPWAAVGLTLLRSQFHSVWRAARPRQLALLALAAVTLLVVLSGWPFVIEATRLGVMRWSEQTPYRRGEALLAKGSAREAEEAYRRANSSLADTRYGLAASLLRQGRAEEALQQLGDNEPPDRFEPFIIRGEAARLSGDLEAARTLFNTRVVKLAGDGALRWAWDHLDPPPVDTLDIGSGLDIGYIRGFHSPEESAEGQAYRWTLDSAEVRKVRTPPTSEVTFTWSGWRPDAVDSALVDLRGPGTSRKYAPRRDPGWEVAAYAVSVGQLGEVQIQIKANPFVASGADPRLLGVRLAKIGSDE